jgi:Fic family protein
MNEELEKLIEVAKQRPFPEAEREAQRRSFAYGNAKIENDRITWEMVDDAFARLKAGLGPR